MSEHQGEKILQIKLRGCQKALHVCIKGKENPLGALGTIARSEHLNIFLLSKRESMIFLRAIIAQTVELHNEAENSLLVQSHTSVRSLPAETCYKADRELQCSIFL